MQIRYALLPAAAAVVAATTVAASAAATATSGTRVPYATSVQTPQTGVSHSGTLIIGSRGPGKIVLTVNDGQTVQQTPLVIGANNTFALDPSGSAAVDAATVLTAEKFMSDLTIANYAGAGAAAVQNVSDFAIPGGVAVLAIGSPAFTQLPLTLNRTDSGYRGTASEQTTIQLPSSGIFSPGALGLKNADGALTDTVSLTVTVPLNNGQPGVISGDQTDVITVPGKKPQQVTITSHWSVSATS